jgi:hypothetical protein
VVKKGFQCIERKGDIGGVFAGGVLVLKAGGEGLADQSFLPFIGQSGMVAITAPQNDPAKLRTDPKSVLQNVG